MMLKLVINGVYLVGVISSVLVGAYGVYIIAAVLIIFPGIWEVSVVFGLPIIAVCVIYLSFVLRLVFSRRWEQRRYDPRSWVLALLGACALWGLGAFVASYLRGF